jgi:predicted neutral ceramidase superfamily lipid hydrolase
MDFKMALRLSLYLSCLAILVTLLIYALLSKELRGSPLSPIRFIPVIGLVALYIFLNWYLYRLKTQQAN